MVRRASQTSRYEPIEYTSHYEACQDKCQDDNEADVEEQGGDEATRCDFGYVACVIALHETWDSRSDVGATVEEASSVFAASRRLLENCADCEVYGVCRYGLGVKSNVWIHVEDGAVDHKVVGEISYLVPVVPEEHGGFLYVELGKGGRGVERTKRTRQGGSARIIGGGTKGQALAGSVFRRAPSKVRSDILTGFLLCE